MTFHDIFLNQYFIKFSPIFKEVLWGGNNIAKLGYYGCPECGCGEMWALSNLSGKETIISNGPLTGRCLSDILPVYKERLVGRRIYRKFGNKFPLLFKIIDAKENLSIQVHPDDTLAKSRGLDNGKTEMWYILKAEPGSKIINGFKCNVNKTDIIEILNNNNIESYLREDIPVSGDAFFIPAGTVHAIGAGVMLVEIQQSSDCTYRIYDYNRKDSNGKHRDLHINEAVEAISCLKNCENLIRYTKDINKSFTLLNSAYFTSNILVFDKELQRDFFKIDSFKVVICVKGNIIIKCDTQSTTLKEGELVLIPAFVNRYIIIPQFKAEILEVFIDDIKN